MNLSIQFDGPVIYTELHGVFCRTIYGCHARTKDLDVFFPRLRFLLRGIHLK